MDDFFYLILGGSCLVGAALGYVLGRFAAPWLLYGLWAVMAIACVVFTSDSVMDALGISDSRHDRLALYAIILLFGAPALLGSLCTGIPMLVRRKNKDETED